MMKKLALAILLAGMQTHAYAQSVPTKAQVNAEILNTINANGRNGITGPILQADLVQMLAVSASWQGAWGSSVYYSYGEIVSYSGSLWFANTPTLGTPPGSVAGQWTQFSVAAGVITPGTTLIVGGTPGDIEYNNNGVLGEKSTTGSGSVVLSTSPSLTTPDLGTPSAANLANATNLPIATGVSGLGANVADSLAIDIGSAGSVVTNGGALGTPSSGDAGNLTGLPISTGVSGLGIGVAAALSNPLNGSGGVLGTSLASADLFIGNGSGIAAGVPMSGDATISNSGALTLATSGVTAATYGDSTHSTQVTFDAKGRATSASSVTITHASGDLAAANNLSDVVSAATARTNLGLGNLATQNAGTGLGNSGGSLNLQPAQNATIGGVEAIPSASHQWIAYIDQSGVPHQTQPSFADISGTNGVASGGTGNTSLTTNVIYKGAGTSPMVASSCSDTGFVFQCSEPTSLGGNALLQGFTTGSAASTGQVLVLDASGDVEPATTSTTDGFVGIAHANAASSGLTLNVAIAGQHVCLFDGPTTAKDWVVFSSTVAGDCHDTGSATRATGQYQIGQVLSTNASAGSYTINIENQYTPAGGSGGTTPASNVTYTPPGTGGVATTVNAILQQGEINPVNYGAKCDGSTDDSAAFQDAINQSESANIPLVFSGTCYIGSSLTVSSALTIVGYGINYSILKVPAGIVKLFSITTTSAVNFQHFQIIGPVTPSSGDTAILVAPSSGENALSYFDDIYINNLWHGFNFARASQWKVLNSNVNVYGGDGFLVANPNNVDSGDSTIQGTQILCNDSSGCGGAIYYQSSGGLRFVNSKVNANGGNFTYGLWMALASGANTGVLILSGDSIENVTDGVYFSRAGTTGTFARVNIVGTEFLVTSYGFLEPTDANGSWLSAVTASNIVVNLTSGTAVNAFNFATTVAGLQIGPASVVNSGSSSSTKAAITGTQTSSNCAIGPIVGSGTFAASSLGSCTSISPN